MFSNLSIKQRLVLGYGCVLGVMVCVLFMLGSQFSKVHTIVGRIVSRLNYQVDRANSLMLAVDQQHRNLRGYVLTGEDGMLHDYKDASQKIDTVLEDLRENATGRHEINILDQIDTELKVMKQEEIRVLSLCESQKKRTAYWYYQAHVYPSAMQIMGDIAKYTSSGLAQIRESEASFNDADSLLVSRVYVSFVVAALLALFFILITMRSVTVPAKIIADSAEAITKGDYEKAINAGRRYGMAVKDGYNPSPKNEMRQIAVALGKMARILRARERILSAHVDISNACASSIDLQRTMDSCLDELAAHTNSQVGAIYLKDNESWVARSTFGLSQGVSDAGWGGPGGITETAMRTRRSVVLCADSSEASFMVDAGLGNVILSSIACIPIVVENQPLGVIVLGSVYELEKSAIELCEMASSHIGIAVRNALSHQRVQELADNLRKANAKLDSQNEELIAQNEEIQIQYERLKLAEEQARSDRERLQAIIDHMPEGVLIATAPAGQVYVANRAALRLYGLEEAPDCGLPEQSEGFRLFQPNGEPIPHEETPLAQALTTGKSYSGYEVLIRQPAGKDITALLNVVPMKDENGNITGSIGVFQDITALKAEQRMLQKGYDQQRTIAETLQKAFLPRIWTGATGYEIADAYVSAGEDALVGGDFYDVFDVEEGVLGVIIADVSGKGVSAAVYTAMAKYMLRAFASEDPTPASVITRLNKAMARFLHGEVFITLFYGLLYTKENRLVYANGGHELPLVLRREFGECTSLDSTGPAVGVIPDCSYTQHEIQLRHGDALVLYTDGITEARRPDGFLGLDGLESMLSRIGDVSAREISTKLLAGVREFTSGKLRDDVAMLIIKSLDPAEEARN